MKIYIAGKITGDSNYKKKFSKAEKKLKRLGHAVMNPAVLNSYSDFSWSEYIKITKVMQKCCDATLFLPDWEDSKVAILEYKNAKKNKQTIFFNIKDIPNIKK